MLLKNKTAILTGCNRGIGKSILEIFAENGCNIFACSRTESDEFSSSISNLVEKYHVEITPIYFDLKHTDQIKESTKKIISSKQNIDILGCSVTGGYVYSKDDIPSISGYYLFADYCTGKIWGFKKTKTSL